MNSNARKLVSLGMKRRKKELTVFRLLIFFAVFLLAAMLLTQDLIDRYFNNYNLRYYGEWFLADTDGAFSEREDLERSGEVLLGSGLYYIISTDEPGSIKREDPPEVYTLSPESEDVAMSGVMLGCASEDFLERNRIAVTDGRLPQSEGEIALTGRALTSMHYSLDLGQELSLYTVVGVDNKDKGYKDADDLLPFSAMDGDISLVLRRFTLVGVLESYNMRWGADIFPGALISREEYDSIWMPRAELNVYYLKSEYVSDPIWEYPSKQIDDIRPLLLNSSDPEHPILRSLNFRAYDAPLWGSVNMFRGVSVLLTAAGAAAIAYFASSYLIKRRKYYLRVRELGASMGTVRTMAAGEYFSVVLPPSSLGILAAYSAAFIAALIISRTTGYDMLSAFLPRTALIILAAVIVMLLAALIAALLLFSGRGLHEKKQVVSSKAKRAFSRRAERGRSGRKPYLGLGETLVRDGRAHSINTFLVSAASVILAALIAFSATNVYNSIRDYIKYKNEVVDMYAVTSGGGNVVECTVDAQQKSIIEKGRVVIADYDYVNCVMHSIGRDDEYVIPSSVLEKLTEDPGIERLTVDTFDSSRAMSWENKEADAFVNALVETAIHSPIYADKKLVYTGKRLDKFRSTMESTFYKYHYLSEPSELWKAAKKYLDPAAADYEAFLRGEQIVVVVDRFGYSVDPASIPSRSEYVSESEFAASHEDLWASLGASFGSGETVNIASRVKDAPGTEVVVAGIVPADMFGFYDPYTASGMYIIDDDAMLSVFRIYGSAELAKKVIESDGNEYYIHNIGIWLNSKAQTEGSRKNILSLLEPVTRVNGGVSDLVEYKELMRSDMIKSCGSYGVFTAALLLLFFFLIRSYAKEKNLSLAGKVDELRRIGASDGELQLEKNGHAFKKSLWLLLTLPALIVALYFKFMLVDYRQSLNRTGDPAQAARELSRLLALIIKNPREFFIEGYQFNIPVSLTVTALLILFTFLILRKLPSRGEKNAE